MSWINKDTQVYCSFAKNAGNTGCQMMNSAFYYYNLNKIYKSFSIDSIADATHAVRTLGIRGFAITMPYKREVLRHVDEIDSSAAIGAANTVINNGIFLKAYNTDYLAALEYLNSCKDILKDRVLYILGSGGYATAVRAAAKELQLQTQFITRDIWGNLFEIKNGVIYNCTPVEDLNEQIDDSNVFIDGIVTTPTGRHLATLQAAHQFKLYTGLEFPFGDDKRYLINDRKKEKL